MTGRGRALAGGAGIVALAFVPPLLLAGHWLSIRTWQPLGIEAFVDTHDIGVYFASSRWVAGGPPLYSGSPSEYPLMANLVFATVRMVSDAWRPVSEAAGSFEATWVTLGWWMWLAMLVGLWRWAPHRSIALWLTPAALYFTLYRFDVYPVAFTFWAFLLARDGRLRSAALVLGIAIGLKGYALFAVPAFAVWVLHERGWREATVASVLAAAPLAASMLLVLGTDGPTAALSPFHVQAIRGSNGQSTWDVICRAFGMRSAQAFLDRAPLLPFALQILSAVAAAALRPRTFDAFLRCFVIGVGGFVTFSVFYSPQFYLWFVPAVALATGVAMVAAMTTLGWLTIVYFPLAYHHGRSAVFYRSVMAAVTILRTAVIGAAILPFLRRRSRSGSVRVRPS